MKSSFSAVAASIMTVWVASSAEALQQAEQTGSPQITALSLCLPITDAMERLTCLDSAARAIDAAVREGTLLVVDQGRAEEARRDAFGTNAAPVDLLQSPGSGQRIDGIESTLTRATQGADGRWRFTLADGSVWAQTDTDRVRNPDQPGATVRVRRGALGSYLLVVGRGGAVRVRRQ